MTDDNSGLTDEVLVELNGVAVGQPARIPSRPAPGASKKEWGAYVVALGLHPDEVGNHDRAALIKLADRFGG